MDIFIGILLFGFLGWLGYCWTYDEKYNLSDESWDADQLLRQTNPWLDEYYMIEDVQALDENMGKIQMLVDWAKQLTPEEGRDYYLHQLKKKYLKKHKTWRKLRTTPKKEKKSKKFATPPSL